MKLLSNIMVFASSYLCVSVLQLCPGKHFLESAMKQVFFSMMAAAAALALTACEPDQTVNPVAQSKSAGPVANSKTIEIPATDHEVVEQKQAEVGFVTGGIGDDERAAIQAASKHYNLHVTNTSAVHAFVGESEITILSATGQEMLRVTSGPLLYAQMPAGKYTLNATRGEQTQSKPFTISGKKRSTMQLIWETAPRAAR